MPSRLQNSQWWLHYVNGEPSILFYIDKVEVDGTGESWVTYTRYMGGRSPQTSRLKESELAVINNSKWTKHVTDTNEISRFLMLWGNFGC
jgi:hypothetical protein